MNIIVKQRDLKDCGICCLSSIIQFYKGYVPLEQLRSDAYVDKDGTSAYHLIETLKKYNFQAYGFKITAEEIAKYPLPAIVHFHYSNGLNHFVVLLSYKANTFTLMDPAKGKIKIKKDEFLKNWTNIIITCYPKSQIPSLPKHPSVINHLLKILETEKKYLIFAIFFSILITICQIFENFFSKLSYNQVSYFQPKIFTTIALFYLSLVIIKISFESLSSHLKITLNKNVKNKLIFAFLKHLVSLPMASFNSYSKGEILTRIKETETIQNGFTELFYTCFFDLILSLIALLILFNINEQVTFLLIGGFTIYLFLSLISSHKIYRLILEDLEEESLWNTALTENIDVFNSMKHLNQTNFIFNRLTTSLLQYTNKDFQINDTLRRQSMSKTCCLQLTLLGSFIYSLNLVGKQTLTIYDVLLIQMITTNFLEPLKKLIELLPSYYYLKGLLGKISDFSSLKTESLEEYEELSKIKIEFQNVSFSYNGFQNNLANLNFLIPSSKHILLDGPSGCGESTVCKLIFQEEQNFEGQILLNDKNIKDYSLGTIRHNITYLSQNEKLINGTIKENILFGRRVPEEVFDEICLICHLEPIVCNKPFRYQDYINITNPNLSGGETQRIILARALLNPSIAYILDECLSEVNQELEESILKKIKKFLKGKTLIYISHKKTKIKFDEVITIDL